MRLSKKPSARSACARPSAPECVQIFVATKAWSRLVAARRACLRAPPRAAAVVVPAGGGVESQACDHDVGVAAVRVHGDPLAGARPAPALEAARVEWLLQEPSAVHGVADGAGAV